MQCPACNASLQSTAICPRCQADLSVLLRIHKQSRIKLAEAILSWVDNQHQQSQVHIISANSLHQDQLSQHVQSLIHSQTSKAPTMGLSIPSKRQLFQHMLQVSRTVIKRVFDDTPALVASVCRFLQQSTKRLKSSKRY